MTTLILSDVHLTQHLDRRKFALLERIITAADRVILNGDFWDGYLTTFDRFVTSDWREIFPLLKERATVYIYGNHDREEWADERVAEFSVEQVQKYRLTAGSRTLIIQHGHRVMPHVDSRLAWLPVRTPLAWLGVWFELGAVRLFGPGVMEVYRWENTAAKTWAAAHLKPNEILVTGHSHLAELDLERQFACSGFVRYGHASYLTLTDDKPELISEQY